MSDEDIKKNKERSKYYLDWLKHDFANSGIGTGQLSLDQEIGFFFQFLKEINAYALHKNNTKLVDKIHNDRENIISVIKKRAEVDKELSDTLQDIVDYYMKLE